MPRAVIDSTVLISAFLTQRGVSGELLRSARSGAFLLYLSEAILEETQGVLLDDERRHRRRYRYPDTQVTAFVDGLRDFATLVSNLPQVTVVIRDPNDDMVIATALTAQVSYIVTRDDDLLSLNPYEGMTILSPEAFMGLLRERGRLNP
jgi:putative PIN family toxin of toxin-antitoxin system